MGTSKKLEKWKKIIVDQKQTAGLPEKLILQSCKAIPVMWNFIPFHCRMELCTKWECDSGR